MTLVTGTDGKISGTAMGSGVTGSWAWRDGWFCRDLDWNAMDLACNCQLVKARAALAIRFTTDKGTGRSAGFELD